MDTLTRVQILDEIDCISHSTNTLGKGMNLIILPPSRSMFMSWTQPTVRTFSPYQTLWCFCGFHIIDKPLVQNFLVNSNIKFLSGIASLQRNMKWAGKALCVAFTDSPTSKIVSTANSVCIQAVICNNSVKCKYSFNVEKQFYFK